MMQKRIAQGMLYGGGLTALASALAELQKAATWAEVLLRCGWRQRPLRAPASVQTERREFVRDAAQPRRIGECHATAVNRDVTRRALVVHLLDSRGPAHVVWLVVSVVVDAFQRATRRTWPDVVQEGREIAAPLVADGDTAPTIVNEGLPAWVKAASQHFSPRTVLARLRTAVRMVVFYPIAVGADQLSATATLRASTSQARRVDGFGATAVAGTPPHRMRASASINVIRCALKHGQHPEPSPS